MNEEQCGTFSSLPNAQTPFLIQIRSQMFKMFFISVRIDLNIKNVN